MYDSLHLEGEATIDRELPVALKISIAECTGKLATGMLDHHARSLNGRCTMFVSTCDGNSLLRTTCYQMWTLSCWKCDGLAKRYIHND
jgi:hypothetical protein